MRGQDKEWIIQVGFLVQCASARKAIECSVHAHGSEPCSDQLLPVHCVKADMNNDPLREFKFLDDPVATPVGPLPKVNPLPLTL